MTISGYLYKLFIGPLELLFEFIFAVIYRHVPHPIAAILGMSIMINLLVMPLYRRADKMQAEEREIEARLSHWKTHINKTFKGDERFMMLQTYYAENNYKPFFAVKSFLPLLLEVPFFLAAYHFLSNLRILNGESFGPIRDLAAPDALLTVSGITVNVLPVLMTLINFLSAAVYLKGFPLKNKIQTYGTALVFLFFLYRSPSGLVIYWTLNNLFSLFRNLFAKLKIRKGFLRVCGISAVMAGMILLNYLLLHASFTSGRKLFLIIGPLVLLWILVAVYLNREKIRIVIPPADRQDSRLFVLSCLFLAILTGILIPSTVIKTSPGDFINIQSFYSPVWYIISAALLAAGSFMIWFNVFYKLANPSARKIMSIAAAAIAVCSAVNYMFFGTERGDMSGLLIYNTYPQDPLPGLLTNIIILMELVFLLLILWKRKKTLLSGAVMILSCAVGIMSVLNVVNIQKELIPIRENAELIKSSIPTIPLSKNGKNVIILMMDRSIGYYIPFLMEERPELQKQFDGFTFYPNTMSFGSTTNEGLPAVYGGYEYVPKEINARSDVPLVEKHNEALRMMPQIFSNEGYEVTISDPSYADYSWISNLKIFEDIPNTKAFFLKGLFSAPEIQGSLIETLNRNFFCYSIYKCAPLIMQPVLYTGGAYNDIDVLEGEYASVIPWQKVIDLLTGNGISDDFQQAYGVLTNLPSITKVTDSDINTFLALDNVTTHQPTLLQLPDYVPSDKVYNAAFDTIPAVRRSLDGRELKMDTFLQVSHYHINMAAYLTLGKWMDFLRENGVYDNSRIIIVADHGQNQDYAEHKIAENVENDILSFNPVLMVKDFGSRGFQIDSRFMTNADVPTIAMEGLIEDPVNPATGNPVVNDMKNEPAHEAAGVIVWDTLVNNGNTFLPANRFEITGDDIFSVENWKLLGEY